MSPFSGTSGHTVTPILCSLAPMAFSHRAHMTPSTGGRVRGETDTGEATCQCEQLQNYLNFYCFFA